jgi:hypothetical protein
MMLCLALRSSPQQVYERALRQFTVGEISEAFAAARGLALPSQLRKMMRAQGRDLHAEFVRLLPTPPRPIGVQRWSTRRVTLLLVVLLVLIPVAVPMAWVFASSSANPGGAAATGGWSGNGSCTQLEELWLEAQSVPSASRIPCVQALPAGIYSALAVRDGGSVLELSHASLDISLIAGEWPRAHAAAGSVTIRLTATCAVQTTGQGQTVTPGVRRFQLDGPASTPEVVDVFPGGCVTYQQEPGAGTSAALLDQAQYAVTFRTRDDLREVLRRHSGDRLDLDPAAA